MHIPISKTIYLLHQQYDMEEKGFIQFLALGNLIGSIREAYSGCTPTQPKQAGRRMSSSQTMSVGSLRAKMTNIC